MTNQNDLSLVNSALNIIGSDRVTSLDNTVNSKAIQTANQFLPLAKQETLRARDWNAARGRKELIACDNESLGEWDLAYRVPVDLLCMRRFASSCREIAFAAYSIENDSENKRVLYTTCGTNKIIYTKNLDDVARWDSLLFNACILKLAHYLAGPIVRDFKLQQAMLNMLDAQFTEACGVDEGEGGLDVPYDRTLVSVRF